MYNVGKVFLHLEFKLLLLIYIRDIATILEIPISGLSEQYDAIATDLFQSSEHWQGILPGSENLLVRYQSVNADLVQLSLKCQYNSDMPVREHMRIILEKVEPWKDEQPTWGKFTENNDCPTDTFSAILCLRYFYIQHHARIAVVHNYVHSNKRDEELDKQITKCIQATRRFCDILDYHVGKQDQTFPNLVGFLHM
jgi:hypothetical protein